MCSKYYHNYSIHPKYEHIYYILKWHWINKNIEQHSYCDYCTSMYINKIKIIANAAMYRARINVSPTF